MSKSALFGVALSLVVVAEAAYAEGPCPQGSIDVDQRCGGGFCQPVCAPIQNYGGGGSQQAPQPKGELTTLGLQTWAASNHRSRALEALRSYGAGYWKLPKGKAGNCYAASFISSQGAVMIPGEGGLLLMGPDIPVDWAAKPRQVDVVLVANGGDPIRARARQSQYISMLGSLAIPPPIDLERIFTADRVNIRVQSNGRTIFAMNVPGGLKVREKILQCKQLSASR